MTEAIKEIDQKTIADFGEQWVNYRENLGYYGSVDCLQDIFGQLLSCSELIGKNVAEIGSGTGRIVNMLLDAGVRSVIAIEPSKAADVMADNVATRASQVNIVRSTGEAISEFSDLDFVFSIGVLHHIVDPGSCIRAAYKALKPGGKMLIWVYGREGNELYLSLSLPLRKVTTRLPHSMLRSLASILCACLNAYVFLCRILPLPMKTYMLNHIAKLDNTQREMTIYDQLNPAYAKYYPQKEARDLLAANGFANVRLLNRHKYSWTVVGEKPA